MRKIISWALGVTLGAGAGTMLVAMFVPETSEEITHRLKEGYQETLVAARRASQKRRIELERELEEIQRTRQLPNHEA